MDKLQIYGVPISRAIRVVWAALELGIEFENVQVGWHDKSIHSDAYRRINPNGRVPAIKDGEFILWESLAINLYLAKKHGGLLAPATLQEEALAWQWTLWAATQLERPLVQWAFNAFINAPAQRNPELAARAMDELAPLFWVLDQQLGRTRYLAADRFTIADLNVGAVMLRSRQQLDFAHYPKLRAWDKAVFERPAAKRAWAIRVEAAARLS